jgi:hypothetical protein
MTPAPTAALRGAIYRRAAIAFGVPQFIVNFKAG